VIPKLGRAASDVLAELRAHGADDVDWRAGRVFSLVYHAGDEHEQLIKDAHAIYASANLLNPMAFKGLRAIEKSIVESAGALLNHPGAVGAVTSGGTESILCAVAAYRDRARRKQPWNRWPQLVVPRTIHPAFARWQRRSAGEPSGSSHRRRNIRTA
jgi:sphinganine-1-phosphate aldolase